MACDRLIERAARRTRPRVGAIMASHGLDPELDPSVAVRRIVSVNTKACRDALRQLQPAVVAVCDARVIRRETLRAVSAPFIGYHAGIYPKYLGRHPGYWALANGPARARLGVTVHLVEEGLGTGRVLSERVAFTPEDDITTYPWVQLVHGLPLLTAAIEDALSGRINPREVHMPLAPLVSADAVGLRLAWSAPRHLVRGAQRALNGPRPPFAEQPRQQRKTFRLISNRSTRLAPLARKRRDGGPGHAIRGTQRRSP